MHMYALGCFHRRPGWQRHSVRFDLQKCLSLGHSRQQILWPAIYSAYIVKEVLPTHSELDVQSLTALEQTCGSDLLLRARQARPAAARNILTDV